MTNVSPQKAPTTYAEWSAYLDMFEAGLDDDAALAAMRAGTLSWTGGVAPLFARRISATLDTRLRRIGEDMSRNLRLGGDVTVLSRVMLDARKKLASVNRLAAIPFFADELRTSLERQITQYAEMAQQSLEDSAKQDRSGHVATTIRQCSLLQFKNLAVAGAEQSGTPVPSFPTETNRTPGLGSARRRNILV
jgi:hypothetical protein